MKLSVVGVGDCRVSRDPDTMLVTYALGSCIAVILHDPVSGVGGMLHFLLPDSGLDREKAQQRPFLFADTGIPMLFRRAYELGARKSRLVVTAVGGAQVMDPEGRFNIGKRNRLAVRKILWRSGIAVHAEDVGGTCSRTVRLELTSGRVVLRKTETGEREMWVSYPGKGGSNGFQCFDRR